VTVQNNAWQGATGGGILGLIVLFIDVMIFCMFVSHPTSSSLFSRHHLHLLFDSQQNVSERLADHISLHSLQLRSFNPPARRHKRPSGPSVSSSFPSSVRSSTICSASARSTSPALDTRRLSRLDWGRDLGEGITRMVCRRIVSEPEQAKDQCCDSLVYTHPQRNALRRVRDEIGRV